MWCSKYLIFISFINIYIYIYIINIHEYIYSYIFINQKNCKVSAQCDSQSNILKTATSDEGMHYIGLTENIFKEKWNQHKNSFKHESKANSTMLSKYVWELKKKGTTPIISWEVIDHARLYNMAPNSATSAPRKNFTSPHQSATF